MTDTFPSARQTIGSIDRDAIEAVCARLVTGFAYLVDQRRYEELVDLFTPDGLFERPGTVARGREQILSFLNARPATMETRHACAMPFFDEVSADRVSVRTYVTMFHGEADAAGGPTIIMGTAGVVEFHDICTATENGWRIAHHKSLVAMKKA